MNGGTNRMFNNLGGTNLTWLLVLLLLLGDNDNGMGGISCDTLIWLLLLSRFCGDNGCGCGCGNQNRPCGCNAM
ncbi:MAG: chorion class high-cysteine HCB protein 13 [Clostridia bacterium]|nr:chorion class high-cysteine HCB protein 13 [Clostridia bacterium]